MDLNQPTPDPILARANDLRRSLFNATAAAQNPDLIDPDWPPRKPNPELGQIKREVEANYYAHLTEHRDHLGDHEDFRNDFEFLDWLATERADLRDHQSWTGDPEEPLRRSDRRRSR
ncbi:hypothetical protein [Nocardia sp. NPDC057272]|uniref:hypothetical protein n=1 Tax=Nocardia sp. NPDC057272 TaxID=3346079 RepID=UPI0036402750